MWFLIRKGGMKRQYDSTLWAKIRQWCAGFFPKENKSYGVSPEDVPATLWALRLRSGGCQTRSHARFTPAQRGGVPSCWNQGYSRLATQSLPEALYGTSSTPSRIDQRCFLKPRHQSPFFLHRPRNKRVGIIRSCLASEHAQGCAVCTSPACLIL